MPTRAFRLDDPIKERQAIVQYAEALWLSRKPDELKHEKPELGNVKLLLHPNIPKPLHGLAPRAILGQTWWDSVREEAYKRNDYHCQACGIHQSQAKYKKWLEAHEIYEIDYEMGRAEMVEVVALCHACHNYIHDGRMQMMARKNKYPVQKYVEILNRGNTLIGRDWKQPFKETRFGGDRIAEWEEWHLVLNGQVYHTEFKNYEDWYRKYNS